MNCQLYNAIKNNDLAELERLIANPDVDKNEPINDNNQLTDLNLPATTIDRVSRRNVQKLLDVGIVHNQRTTDKGFTVLHLAVIAGHLDVVQKILDLYGIDINQRTTDKGFTALHLAINGDNIQIIQAILDAGPDIHQPNNDGNTALHFAVKIGNLAVIQKLLDAWADINQPNNAGFTPLHIAIIEEHPMQIIQMILDADPDIHQQDNDGNTALHLATELDVQDAVYKLLDLGANIHQPNNRGSIVLHAAAFTGNLDIIKNLLDRGAHINQLNNNGVGALHAAIRFAKVKVVSYLLDAGAKHDTSLDTDYFTLLSYAIRVNDYNPKIIKMILDKGYLNAGIFDLDAKDFCVQHPYPYNPHTVEEYTLIKLIKFLYSKGNIDKHSNETFIDITHVDIKDEDLPYYFDQAKFDEVCTEFCLYYSNTEISLYSNNLPITTQIMDNLNKIAVRKILINDLKEEYNKYQNDNSLEKKQLPLFDINFDCIQHLLNKLSNKDIFNFNRSVCNTCIDEVQDDLNKLNISVEGESYTNEIQQEESENDICVIG